MENLKNLRMPFRNWKLLMVVFTGTALLMSCSLKPYVDPRIESSSHTVFINAIADQSSYNIYIDGFRASNQSISFSFALPYIYVTAGVKNIDLVTRAGFPVINDTITFKAGNYYNIFATAKDTIGEFVVLEDAPSNITDPPKGKAKLRLINLSPDSPNIDLFVDNGATLFTDLAYKANTEFIVVDPGNYKLDFRETGTTTTKLVKQITLDANRLYTVMALGVWNPLPADPALDMGLIDGR